MASTENQQQQGQSHLQKQDLATLDITKLTPQSPEVISRQATINIGTIGHVAHGKSTVVKAISNVMTVRFKNELERNITIKLDKLTEQEIYDLTKSSKRERNVRTYLDRMKRARRANFEKSRKAQQQIEDEEATNKIQDILKFLEYSGNQEDNLSFSVIKPKLKSLQEISRDSDSASIAGSSTRSTRSSRLSHTPERFTFEPSAKRKRSNTFVNPNTMYNIEAICSMALVANEVMVLIKWENYPPSVNTWEPLESVKETEALEKFLSYELEGEEEKIQEMCDAILAEQAAAVKSYDTKHKKVVMKELNKFDPEEYRCYQLTYNLIKDQAGYSGFKKKFYHMVVLNHFHEREVAQRKANKEFSMEIFEHEKRVFSISIDNNVDFDILPRFKYVRENKFPPQILAEENEGCECKECSRESKCCPSTVDKAKFGYKMISGKKRLRLNHTQMIYECNSSCLCGDDCLNRVTQQPRLIPLSVFKTDDGRGWGLRTKTSIPTGTFVIEYTGEVIDQEESIRRGKKYDEIGQLYMFDLDFDETSTAVYTIDAFESGNLSRFINHSCEPNLRIWPVSTCKKDSSIYKLCYFASKLIREGEELTFNYSGQQSDHEDDDDDEKSDKKNGEIVGRYQTEQVCKCGAASCRGRIFNVAGEPEENRPQTD